MVSGNVLKFDMLYDGRSEPMQSRVPTCSFEKIHFDKMWIDIFYQAIDDQNSSSEIRNDEARHHRNQK